jgi:hypothetical protein
MPMPHGLKRKEVMARAGLVLAFFIFLISTVAAFQSGAQPVVTVVLGIITVFCLWAAIFASERVAVTLGRWLP